MQDHKTSKWLNQALNSDLLGSPSMSSSHARLPFNTFISWYLVVLLTFTSYLEGEKLWNACTQSISHSTVHFGHSGIKNWGRFATSSPKVSLWFSCPISSTQEGAGTVGILSLLLFGHVWDSAKWPKAWALGHQDWDRFPEWWLSFLSWCPHGGRIFGTVIKIPDFNSWFKSFLCHLISWFLEQLSSSRSSSFNWGDGTNLSRFW